MREAEILRHRLVENAERMGKQDPAIERQLGAAAAAPGGAGKIAKAVDRDHRRVAKWRWVKCRGEMREMVLDMVDGAGKAPARQCGKLVRNAGDFRAVAQPLEQQLRTWPPRHDISELAEKVGPAAAVDGDMGDVAEIDLGFPQAIPDRLRGEAGPVLDAAEPLFFGGSNQHAAAQDAGGGVGMVGVDP